MSTIVVDGTSTRWVGRGFPWVYPKEIVSGSVRVGAEVVVTDRSGRFLGRGFGEQGFLAVRVLRHDDGPLDDTWLHARLDEAQTLRQRIVDPDTDAFRLVHGEGDGLPGVRVDRYAGWGVITLDGAGVNPLVDRIARWLAPRCPDGVALCYRPDPRDPTPRSANRLIFGVPPEAPVVVRERGIRLGIDPLDGPDVGVYADMRPVRGWLEPHWRGRRLLNLFAYTGAFSVAAAVHGAAATVSVDLSRPILDRLQHNLDLNGPLDGDHTTEAEDAFRALDRHRRRGASFDIAVVDPPSYSRGKATFSGNKDWTRLVAATVRTLVPGGWLVVASNQGEMSPRVFDGAIHEGLHKAGRMGRLLFATGQGPDFPAATTFPEGRYLKVRVFAVP